MQDVLGEVDFDRLVLRIVAVRTEPQVVFAHPYESLQRHLVGQPGYTDGSEYRLDSCGSARFLPRPAGCEVMPGLRLARARSREVLTFDAM